MIRSFFGFRGPLPSLVNTTVFWQGLSFCYGDTKGSQKMLKPCSDRHKTLWPGDFLCQWLCTLNVFNFHAKLISDTCFRGRLPQRTNLHGLLMVCIYHLFLKIMATLKCCPLPFFLDHGWVWGWEGEMQNPDKWLCQRWITVALLRVCQNDSFRRQVSSEVIEMAPLLLRKVRYENIWGNFLFSINTAVAVSKHSDPTEIIY